MNIFRPQFSTNGKFPIIGFIIIVVVIIGMVTKGYYSIDQLSLNGQIQSIRVDVSKSLYITVNYEEHALGHLWPKLQRNAELGDSVIKAAKSQDIILIKKRNKLRFVCALKE